MRFLIWQALTAVLAAASEASELASEIAALSTANPVVNLDTESFERLVNNHDRDFAVLVCFTVLSTDYQCEPCRRFEPELVKLSYSWRREDAEMQPAARSKVTPLYF